MVQCPWCLLFNHVHLECSIPWPAQIPYTTINIKVNLLMYFFFFYSLNRMTDFLKRFKHFYFEKYLQKSSSFPLLQFTRSAPNITGISYSCSPVPGFLIQLSFCLSFSIPFSIIQEILADFPSTIQKYCCEGTLQWSCSGFTPLGSRICPINTEEQILPIIIKMGQSRVNQVGYIMG